MPLTHVISEGLHEQQDSGQLLGPGDHEGVGLKVDGGSEVDGLHALAGHGEGSYAKHHLRGREGAAASGSGMCSYMNVTHRYTGNLFPLFSSFSSLNPHTNTGPFHPPPYPAPF